MTVTVTPDQRDGNGYSDFLRARVAVTRVERTGRWKSYNYVVYMEGEDGTVLIFSTREPSKYNAGDVLNIVVRTNDTRHVDWSAQE